MYAFLYIIFAAANIFATAYLFPQPINKILDTNCVLSVSTDNNKEVDIWLNRIQIGKTPLNIIGIVPGLYNISFMDPVIRDSILNSGTSIDDIEKNNGVSRSNVLTRSSSTNLMFASGEIARESNKFVRIDSCTTTQVVFKISKAEKIEKNAKNSSMKLIQVGKVLGIIGAILIPIILIYTIVENLPK